MGSDSWGTPSSASTIFRCRPRSSISERCARRFRPPRSPERFPTVSMRRARSKTTACTAIRRSKSRCSTVLRTEDCRTAFRSESSPNGWRTKKIELGHSPRFSEGNMKLRLLYILSSCSGIAAGYAPAWALDGAALYKTHCSACHEAGEQRAPARSVLKQLSPQQIITALEKGAMIAQGAERSRAERRVLAEHLSGKPLDEMVNPIPRSAFCQSSDRDFATNVYAVDAETGELRWKVKVDDYPLAWITGSPTLHDGRLYVPLSAREESQVSDPKYVCCKFRGSVVALDAADGKPIWKTYVIEKEAQPTRISRIGTQLWGPAGGAVWSAPTVDPKQNAIYVGTGNSYSFPPVKTTDAIVAMDMKTGKIRWVRQMIGLDVWNGGCRGGDPEEGSEEAPDSARGASRILGDGSDGTR